MYFLYIFLFFICILSTISTRKFSSMIFVNQHILLPNILCTEIKINKKTIKYEKYFKKMSHK